MPPGSLLVAASCTLAARPPHRRRELSPPAVMVKTMTSGRFSFGARGGALQSGDVRVVQFSRDQ